ncbi:selenocysteine-specific translation elongation factor [Pelagibaculum spongiae]|uniref:Selenocysteine-specific translation elongation factor n=1 Tax=Pelagibaculum spongiae TaxID=2080658 RepID=A0A2V1GXC8_9GAMM|nr:selenocysteine-specific translation elongation factor [Pelagibaculum spongiae]PVZ71831.1 selenocysteine-specific translation elongation factor [Pelagibaculum spongiae]
MRNAVIGTAGHVDHGKTALIHALTGIMTARKHEQDRGMTMDLGFAWFPDDEGGAVGVIDVPGHERYIRNMVSGVWSLDLALLVISAEEGWMPMTTDHLRVLSAMGVSNVILVVNKCDLVDAETLAMVEEDALDKCMEIADILPDSISVSALEGTNIQKLRQMVLKQLRTGEQPPRMPGSHLYIDRVFTVNGIGTVVTGSLAGEQIEHGQKMTMLPGGQQVQVKALQSYKKDLKTAVPTSRVAVGLKGVAKKDVERGHCLVASGSGFKPIKDMLVRLDFEAAGGKHNREVEVVLGTAHSLARLIPLKDSRFARLKISDAISCHWGQKLVIIRHGGSDILHAAEVVWMGELERSLRSKVQPMLERLPEKLETHLEQQLGLEINGYAEISVSERSLSGDYVTLGRWLATQSFQQKSFDKIVELLGSETTTFSADEISSKLSIEIGLLELLLNQLQEQGLIRNQGGVWQTGGGADEAQLSELALTILQKIRDNGKAGFEAEREKIPGAQKELRNLVRLEFIIQMEGKLYYPLDLYQELVVEILQGRAVGDKMTIAQAREISGLSRKFLIPLLNRMSIDGFVRNENPERVVLKLPQAEL